MGIKVLEQDVLLGDCMRKAQQRDEKRNKSEFAEWFKVCRHFFPNLPRCFNAISDPRSQPYITYSQAVLLSMCIMKNVSGKIEHLCSREPNAMKAHYLMTQLSDILMQLYLAFGVILGSIKRPIKSVAQKIGEHFWSLSLTQKDVEIISKKTALRLNT